MISSKNFNLLNKLKSNILGNTKYRALRLDQGSFSWATEAISRKVRVIDVVYNASNNELVRTKTLVKGAIITIDSTPFRQVKFMKFLDKKLLYVSRNVFSLDS